VDQLNLAHVAGEKNMKKKQKLKQTKGQCDGRALRWEHGLMTYDDIIQSLGVKLWVDRKINRHLQVFMSNICHVSFITVDKYIVFTNTCY